MAQVIKKRQGRPPTMENPRGRILDEAAALFARDGYESASLGSLADAVGVTKAAIYHYYPNKKEIYEAIIVQTLEGLLSHVTRRLDENMTPSEALSSFMSAHAEYFEANYHGFVTMLVGFGGMENSAFIVDAQKIRRNYEGKLRNIIEHGVADGHFRQVDPSVTTRAVLSMLNWMVRWFKPGGERSAVSFAEEYCDLILGGLRLQT